MGRTCVIGWEYRDGNRVKGVMREVEREIVEDKGLIGCLEKED